jgi:hypothetical protein
MHWSLVVGLAAMALAAQDVSTAPDANSGPIASAAPDSNTAVDGLLDRVVLQEKNFLEALRKAAPIVETYIQESFDGPDPDARPVRDHYFLGRFRAPGALAYEPLVERTDPPANPGRRFLPARVIPDRSAARARPLTFLPRGFAQMAVPDLAGLDRRRYSFEYVRREFLGEVRCLVFDVAPRMRGEPGRFVGRIWVEDREQSIVRFNGTYVPAPTPKGAVPEFYFHFDSWRVNVAPGVWVPAQIYIEEEAAPGGVPRFKAQTRIWDFHAAPTAKLDELTRMLIESDTVADAGAAPTDASPLESQRAWERQAEENILSRLESGGFLAPPGPVDEVLNTVVNNLVVSAQVNVEAHCRVLLTTPIETFTIGHTIVISRGLIDVLPDEASLAVMLAGELAHIALGHRTPTQFAFRNQLMLDDADLLRTVHFARSAPELREAGRKTIEIMHASPYQKTGNAGLFLKALRSRETALPRLLAANIGNQVANTEALDRLAEFIATAPELEENKLEQIAALPLGSRVKLNPWNNRIELVKTRPVALLSAREKMPFEVTPFVLFLTRAEPPAQAHAASSP